MSYQQQGNSCGAWCATHRVGISRPEIMASDQRFVQAASYVYGMVQFSIHDGDDTWAIAIQRRFAQWCMNRYSDPWRIISYLEKQGLAPTLNIEPAAATAVGDLAAMRLIVENLKTKGARTLRKYSMTSIGAGAYAIGVFQDGMGLHYVLFHKRHGGGRVYDPRSQQLNWNRITALPAFGTPVTTTIMNPGLQPQNYRFLGVFITC